MHKLSFGINIPWFLLPEQSEYGKKSRSLSIDGTAKFISDLEGSQWPSFASPKITSDEFLKPLVNRMNFPPNNLKPSFQNCFVSFLYLAADVFSNENHFTTSTHNKKAILSNGKALDSTRRKNWSSQPFGVLLQH